MNCDIIKDLLPLYIDQCCSEESANEVEKHLHTCKECGSLYKSMSSTTNQSFTKEKNPTKKIKRINIWKASLIQSILLLSAFGLITLGVCFEASTPIGLSNSVWALNLVVPSTGFMLSLANWFFLKLYKTAKKFCFTSCLSTIFITLGAYVWAFNHYNSTLSYGIRISVAGFFLTFFFSLLSAFASYRFAKLSGKE